MFINRLLLKTNDNIPLVIRDIKFHKGLNLIVDETSAEDQHQTGNSVGKTTVLRLIDFCLGAGKDVVYKTERREKVENTTVRNFLENHKVSVELELKYNDINHTFIRSFAKIEGVNCWIDGETVNSENDYRKKLDIILYPNKPEKPTLRQLMSHHIRYQEPALDSTLKTLHQATTDSVYESLYFYMLGIDIQTSSEELPKLEEELKIGKKQLSKLIETHSRNDLELILESLESDIHELEKAKDNFGLDSNTLDDINLLDEIRNQINHKSARIAQLNIRLSVIDESIRIIEGEISNIDMESLRNIYEDTRLITSHILHDFQDLVEYHNKLAHNRKHYLALQIPQLHSEIDSLKQELNALLKRESELKKRIIRKDSYSVINDIIYQLSEKSRTRGQVENQLKLINSTMESINNIEKQIRAIEDKRKSLNLKDLLSEHVKEFNKEFNFVSRELYGEEYALSFDDPEESKKGKNFSFKILSLDNFSTGKKQGEVICFDIAYILFSDSQKRPCMHFLLNDKKELMHNNPLSKIAEFVADKDIQLVFPILRDKIPTEFLSNNSIILKLSQNDKLFRIEEIDKEDNLMAFSS